MVHRRAPFTRRQCKYVNPQNVSQVHIWEGPSRKQKQELRFDVEKQFTECTFIEIFKVTSMPDREVQNKNSSSTRQLDLRENLIH